MVNVSSIRESLLQAAQSTRLGMRCLNTGRDSHDASIRALSLLTDLLDLLYRIKDEISWAEEKWIVSVGRLEALSELISWFRLSMKSLELYFQPGGVSPFYFQKHLLDKTYIPRFEQYKIMFLLSLQPDSEERALLDKQIRSDLKRHCDVEASSLNDDQQFEDETLSLTSRLSSEHFITLSDLCYRRQQGSCSWIFENSNFRQWLTGGFRSLYCVGPPGAGKTFLSSTIIDFLQKTFTSPDVATIFVFCQGERRGKEASSIDLLRTILAQLVFQKRSPSYVTSSLYHSEALKEGSASSKTYQNAIRAEINRFSKVILVLDGLDTFPDRDRILNRIHKFPQHAQLLITLREMGVSKPLENSGQVSVLASPEDIGLYALTRTKSDSSFRRIIGEKNPNFNIEDNIIHSVVEKSHGIFLLAKIHLDLLSQYSDRNSLERALFYLPENLAEAYGESMKQVVGHSPSATRYVYWVLYAFRPLSVAELRSAVKDDTSSKPDSMTFEHFLQIQSAGLLAVDAASGTVRFVHRTAKEYLEGSAARVFFPSAQKDITEACLSAISPDEVVDDCYHNDMGPSRIMNKGLVNYAAAYWGLHAREVDEDEQTFQVLIKTFFNKLLWRRPPLDYERGRAEGMPSELGLGKYPNDWTGLHYLAFFGIPGKAKRLLEQGANVNSQENALGVTPLHCAVYQGNDEMVEFLLEKGGNVNAINAQGQTALHIASIRGHRRCMRLLFAEHIDLRKVDNRGNSCLHAAVGTETDEATVPLLIRHKMDLNLQNPDTGNTALHTAVQLRRPRVILFLLEKGAAIDIPNDEGYTPLQLAANMDNCEAISLLLQHCAHIEARSVSGPTALQYAAWKGHWVAFDLLLIGGADINVWNKQGETLLHEQARHSVHTGVVSKLLNQGANIEARTSQGYTPLQCAAMSGNKVMFQFLLDWGARIDIQTAKGETILHITPPSNQNCLDILQMALDEGLDAKAMSFQGWTPLHQTVYTGTGVPEISSDRTAEYIQLLLSSGASINELTASGSAETPLHLAATSPDPRASLIDYLVQRGANVNTPSGDGKTPLHLTAERGREPLFRILLDAGADLSLEIPNKKNGPVKENFEDPEDYYKETPVTALHLARKNPFGSLWFDEEGQLRPVLQRSGRDSATTLFEDGYSDVSEPETAGDSTLIGSEHPYIDV